MHLNFVHELQNAQEFLKTLPFIKIVQKKFRKLFSFSFLSFEMVQIQMFVHKIQKMFGRFQTCSCFQKLFIIFENVHIFIFSGVSKLFRFFHKFQKLFGLFKKCSRFQKLFSIFKTVHVFIFSGFLKLFNFKFL